MQLPAGGWETNGANAKASPFSWVSERLNKSDATSTVERTLTSSSTVERNSVRSAVRPPLMKTWLRGFAGSEHADPSDEIAIVTALLITVPPVRTITGTQQPAGALAGTVKLTWSTPAQHELRPLYCTVAGCPPTNTSTLVDR